MSAPHLHLATVNGEPTPETCGDRPDHTLLTFTLPKRDIEGAHYGIKNLLWACTRMMQAIDAIKAGDEAEAQKNIDRAFAEMVSANATAERVYEHVKRVARRSRPRKVKP